MRPQPKSNVVRQPPTAWTPGAPRRVLVVSVRGADEFAGAVRRFGHVAIAAREAEEALALAEYTRPHIALVAVDEPNLDGREFGRRLRSLDWGWSVAIAALADFEDESLRRGCEHAGFDLLVVRPIAPSREFLAALSLRTVERGGGEK